MRGRRKGKERITLRKKYASFANIVYAFFSYDDGPLRVFECETKSLNIERTSFFDVRRQSEIRK